MDPKTLSGIISFFSVFILERSFPHYSGRLHHSRHTLYNLSITLLNGILGRFIFLSVNILIFSFIGLKRAGLIYLFPLPYLPRAAIALLLFDLWMYFWHLANHRIPLFWLFHRAHHNDPEMDASTSLRLHPVEICFSSVIRLPVFLLIGMDVSMLAIYESVLMVSILFHHSNISLPVKADKILRIFIVTPDMHRMHHSINPDEINSNYSSIISIWDRIFNTFTKWGNTKAMPLGLRVFREKKWQTPLGILAVPFMGENNGGNNGKE